MVTGYTLYKNFIDAALLAFLWVFLIVLPTRCHAQTFQTSLNNPGNTKYVSLPYGVAFVASDRTPLTSGPPPVGVVGPDYSIGTDIVRVVPTAGHHLYYVTPGSTRVVKLFPLPAHSQISGLIDTPVGQLERGSLTEPSISEDGKRLYFGYFPDAGDGKGNPAGSSVNLGSGLHYPKKGADLYYIDITEALNNPNTFNPSTLPVKRLTKKTFTAGGSQVLAERIKDAINPTEAAAGKDVAVINMHPVEMRGTDGQIKLIFVSNRGHLKNSNNAQGQLNDFNFNLYIADLDLAGGRILNERRFQYYTTTSAVSPIPIKDGIAFSYQANIHENRQWHQQALTSDGRWSPLLGYGRGASSFHLGTYCLKTKGIAPGEYFISGGYYNINNQGFGAFFRLPFNVAGLNELVPIPYDPGKWPQQIGVVQITDHVDDSNQDKWALSQGGGNSGPFYGKGTSPMCARPDELLMAWTYTNANDKSKSGNPIPHAQYDSFIGYRPNLELFDPLAPVNIQNETGLRILVDESGGEFTLTFPVPALTWQARTGQAQQRFSPPNVDVNNTVAAYEPFSVVGTSDLGNSDGTTIDCRAGVPLTPNYNGTGKNLYISNDPERVIGNIDALTWVPPDPQGNTSNYCTPLKTADVFGIEISLTSDKAVWSNNLGYTVDGDGQKEIPEQGKTYTPNEVSKLLGIYDRRSHDGSFKAKIPANAPFQFHLLHKKYGLRLTDLKSWHSMYPGETRTDCGGCHGHDVDITPQPVPFEGTFADTHAPSDMVNQTPYIEYDAFCNPVMKLDTTPTRNIPIWQDLYPKFDQYCGNCHNSATATHPQKAQAQLALGYSNEHEAYFRLRDRNYMGTELGALGSLAFMAARNERTDGRNNNLPAFAPDFAAQQWGFKHSNHPNLCDGTNPQAAKFVYDFGLFIDHDSPRNLPGQSKNYRHDWFHPTIHGALTDEVNCNPNSLTVGFWDDTGRVKTQDVYKIVNGVKSSLAGFPKTGAYSNGNFTVALSGLSNDDSIGVDIFDEAGNRQKYERSVDELIDVCMYRAGLPYDPNGNATPSPSPSASPSPSVSPSPSASPSPTPGESGSGLSMSVNKSRFNPGEKIKFTVTGIDFQGDFVIAVTNKSLNPGTVIKIPGTSPVYYVPVKLNKSKVLKRTVENLKGNTISKQTVTIKLPKSSVPIGLYHAQAILKVPGPDDKPVKSQTVAFEVQNLKGQKKTTTKITFSNPKTAALYGKKFKPSK